MRRAIPVLLLLVAACSSGATDDAQSIPDLPEIDAAGLEAHLASIPRPAVVNIWASWCLPCRSEAPLLAKAHDAYGTEIEFIGVDVEDTQSSAKDFLMEHRLEFDHFFDRRRSVPNSYGGYGTPITMFFDADGQLVTIHNGIIDERLAPGG